MKTCSWCGSEYADTVETCPIDAQPLSGLASQLAIPDPAPVALAVPPVIPIDAAAAISPIPTWRPSERQLRIFEVVLLCVIAFGGSILYSTYYYLGLTSAAGMRASWNWTYAGVHELAALGLLCYILFRRSRSLSDLGMSWTRKDFGHSFLVLLLALAASSVVFSCLYFSGLTAISYGAAGNRVGRVLFGGGVSLATIAFQFINPFYEELIVRAYLMTEIRQLTNSMSRAVIISTLLQMSYHFYQGAPLAFSEGACFLVLSIYYARTNRITPVILAHLYMDVWGTLAFMLRL
jgi:membrane protease YdiL (CAAX protease family)